MIGVYKITGPKGKTYIGSSVNIRKRFSQHKNLLRKNVHPNKKLQTAYNKYGEVVFKFEIVETFQTANNLMYYEQMWLDILFTSLDTSEIYNLNPRANSILGYRWSDEAKANRQAHINQLATQRAKTYIVCKEDEIVTITNLDQYCRDNGLNIRGFRRMLAGERNHYKGYSNARKVS